MTERNAYLRDEQWVRERFGDVGERPSDEIAADPHAPEQPAQVRRDGGPRGLQHPR
jgi:hypothetical protein